jgi:hypothetical protein
MKLPKLKLALFGAALIALVVVSCNDDFTEADLLEQQKNAKIDELKSVSASDSLQFLLAMAELDYRKYVDSIARADSLAIAAGQEVYLPYSYEVQILNGSVKSITNGKTEQTQAFGTDITVTITQYGVKQTRTGRDGLFTFSDIGVGMIHGTVSGTGFTTFDWTVDASLPYHFFQEAVSVESQPGGGSTGTGVGGSGTIVTYLQNAYILEELLKYFNHRSFGNDFTIFETSGVNAHVLTGRAFIETNTTNRTREVVPTGTPITAYIDAANSTFQNRYVTINTSNPNNDPTNDVLNSVFAPVNWAYEFVGAAATNATGDYTLTLPGSPDGVAIRIEYSDVVADKTYFVQTNGDVTQVTRRNIYGPGKAYTAIPNISLAPTVTFDAGGGATATAVISGDGSVTEVDLTYGGENYQGTPRVYFSAPPAGGTRATGTATVTNGVVTALTLVNGGSGYIAAPTVTITEGAGATASEGSSTFGTGLGGVANVHLTNLGSGYNGILPNVVFFADLDGDLGFDVGEQLTAANFPTGVNQPGLGFVSGTNFPVATAVLNTGNNGLSSVNVTNGGDGMSFEPMVLITSGLGAAATVTIAGGIVTNVTVTNGGLFYSATPTIALPGGAGAGTTTAVLTGALTSGVLTGVTITNAGAGYVDGSYGAVITSVGSGAAGTVVWKGLGIGSITVTGNGAQQVDGLYYTNVPKVVISAPDYVGTGSRQATGTAVLGADGRLVAVNLTDAGSGYYPTLPVTVTILSGSSATATSTLGNRFISEVDVTAGGNGYIVAPSVLIVDPSGNGTGATAVASIDNGQVTSIEVTNAGTGYSGSANVIILDPGTSYDPLAAARYNNPALATVVVTNGAVSLVDVYQNGDNYPAGTRVKIVSSKGNGFTAAAVVASGEINDVTITTAGTGYVGNNYLRALGSAFNPDADVTGGVSLPGSIAFSGVPTFNVGTGISSYTAKSAVKKVQDIEFGSGQTND